MIRVNPAALVRSRGESFGQPETVPAHHSVVIPPASLGLHRYNTPVIIIKSAEFPLSVIVQPGHAGVIPGEKNAVHLARVIITVSRKLSHVNTR